MIIVIFSGIIYKSHAWAAHFHASLIFKREREATLFHDIRYTHTRGGRLSKIRRRDTAAAAALATVYIVYTAAVIEGDGPEEGIQVWRKKDRERESVCVGLGEVEGGGGQKYT